MSATPQLQALSGALRGQRFDLLERALTLGRDRHECRVVFPAGTTAISRLHASIWWDAARAEAVVRDEGSKNGTFVRGVGQLEAGVEYRLSSGTQFWLGHPDEMFLVTTSD